MTRFVALIRGINVGRAKRVAMADLRRTIEKLGYRDVATALNSGNVIFSAAVRTGASAARRIESAIASELGFDVRVAVLSGPDLHAVIRENALSQADTEPSRFFVCVFADPDCGSLLKPLTRKDWTPEMLGVGRRAAYLWCPNGSAHSPLNAAVNGLI